MLNVSNVKSSGQALSYYAKDDHNTIDNTINGSSWQGAGAEKLGLSGKITPEVFHELLEGKIEGQQLGRIEKDENGEQKIVRRAAVDLTFSAPKSVSILAEVFGDERLKEAHASAVSDTLDSISKEAIKTRVTVNKETIEERSSDVIIAKFDHNTNRLQEPDTHTHALLINAVKSSDGKWRSIENSEIYDTQRLYGAMYMNKLAENVQKLGYDIVIKDSKGNFDIKGIDQHTIDSFSTRKQEIDKALEELGLSRDNASAAQREIATLNTRSAKVNIAHDLLKQDWREKAETMVKGDQLVQQSKDRDISHNHQVEYKEAQIAARYAMKTLSEREAVFSERELRREAYERGVGTTTISSTDRQFDKLKDAGVLVDFKDDKITTKAVLNSEEWTLKTISESRGTIEQVVSDDNVAANIAAYEKDKKFKLTEGQRVSVENIFATKDRFIGVQGLAGTGKTTMLEVVKNIANDNNIPIRGMSGTKKAANTLMNESGIQSQTTTMFLINAHKAQKEWEQASKDNPELTREKEIWIVDEASFAGQQQLNSIADLAIKSDARVVFLGDKMQLQAISFGKPFEVSQDRVMDYTEMKEINRQKTEGLKLLVDATLGDKKDKLEQKNIAKALDLMNKQKVIHENEKPLESLVKKMADLPKDERDNSKVITPFNKDRVEFNQMYREELQKRGDLSKDEVNKEAYKRVNRSAAQLKDAYFYQKGDIVQFGAAVRYLGIEKNETLKVIGLNDKRTSVQLQKESGEVIHWKPAKSHRPSVYESQDLKLAVGDKIKFTMNDQSQRFANNTQAEVTSIKDGKIEVKTEDGKQFTLGKNDKHLDHNYASTVYASQGSTYHNTYLYINIAEDAKESDKKNLNKVVGDRMFYVALTRSKMNFEVHTNNGDKLKDALTAKQDKTFALDLAKEKEFASAQTQRFDLERTLDAAQEHEKEFNKEQMQDKEIEH